MDDGVCGPRQRLSDDQLIVFVLAKSSAGVTAMAGYAWPVPLDFKITAQAQLAVFHHTCDSSKERLEQWRQHVQETFAGAPAVGAGYPGESRSRLS